MKTYGCQMNVYDSDRMVDILRPLGYEICDAPDDADMIILNTCHIREKATEKVFSDLGRFKPIKEARAEQGKQTIIAVAGCVAQAEGDEITKRAKYVDMVFGPQTYHKLPEMIAKAARHTNSVLELDFDTLDKFDALPQVESISGVSSFITIQEGCDKFCHFCCVPYTRGAEISRSVAAISDEVKCLIDLGVKEVTLLGQNVNAFHGVSTAGSEWGLGKLLEYLAEKFPAIARWRYTTSHPMDVDDGLIAAHAHERVMPCVHLPVQSGSDKMLQAMNRKHTAQHYLNIIQKFRAVRSDIAFSSDFIVGYPGEEESDFQQTMDLVREVNYSMAYSFTYSRRLGTPAAVLNDQISEQVKAQRLAELQALIASQQLVFNKAQEGLVLPVLFEKKGRYMGQVIGKSPYVQSVHVLANESVIGRIAKVHITEGGQHSLKGIIID